MAEETANEQLHEGYEPVRFLLIPNGTSGNKHLRLDLVSFMCLFYSSFDDDYDSEELQVADEIGNKMEKLVISDLTA